ncbi:MAG: dUTP diphosphatase [Chloroflexi bacterium]|nr:dUTP diphosphatase [Chloroflexota bacterium]
MSIELKIRRLHPRARLPVRATPGASGFDLYACLDEAVVLTETPRMIPCGIAIEFPYGFDAQVRPRSGLSSKGLGVAFGTIDADYRGELLVTMWTFGGCAPYELRNGDRIAQLVIAPLAEAVSVEVAELTETARGDGGHGSTGR